MYFISLSRTGCFRLHSDIGLKVDIGSHFAATYTGIQHREIRTDLNPEKPVGVLYYELRVPEQFARKFGTPRVVYYTTCSSIVQNYLYDALVADRLQIFRACRKQNRQWTWYVPEVDGVEMGMFGARL